jgi:hypothetical protein
MESIDRREQSADVLIKYFMHGSLSFTERVPRSLYVATVTDRADVTMKAP